MNVKIRCNGNREMILKALDWAKKKGATFAAGGDAYMPPMNLYGLLIHDWIITWTDSKAIFESAFETDITNWLFETLDVFKEIDKQDAERKAKQDADKPRLTLVPMSIMWDIAKVREYGCKKYPDGGVENWRQVSPERYREAAFRHFLRYLDDPQGVDEESGLPHRWHLETNLAFLAALEGDGHD